MTPKLAPTLRATFSSLRHRSFRLFFIGQSISNSGSWLTNVALYAFALVGGVLLSLDNPLRRSFVSEMVLHHRCRVVSRCDRVSADDAASRTPPAAGPTTLVVAHRTLVTMRDIVRGAAALGVSLLVLSMVPGVAWAVPAVFLVGAASLLYMTGTTTIVQLESRRDMHARLLAPQTVLLGGSAAIGGPLLGWIADTAGARMLMVIGGVVSLGAATFGTVMAKRL